MNIANIKNYTLILLISGFSICLVSCSDSDDPAPSNPTPTDPVPALKAAAAVNYADNAHANYQDALALALELQVAIEALLVAPTDANLEAAKSAWLAARVPYGQTEVFRFYNGPIDNEEDGPEGQLNAWPMDEGYVDYVVGNPNAGIINNLQAYPVISLEVLTNLNEKDGEANISTGYHAIEFLLWGQDFSAEGPGDRPVSDFGATDGQKDAIQQRRADYLRAVTTLLIQDLEALVAAWEADQNNYRQTFVADEDQAIANMLQGMGGLAGAELSGERMAVALDTRDQEDEHSCFSDNTHVDILENARGIRNVYLGRYVRVDGTIMQGSGLKDVVAELNASLDDEMQAALDAAITACEAIPEPFDQAIVDVDGRAKVQAAIDALRVVAERTVDVADLLGITLNLEV